MRDDRGAVLDEDTGAARESLAMLRLAANAAGYDTAHPAIQAALIRAYGDIAVAANVSALAAVMARCGDYLRDIARRGRS